MAGHDLRKERNAAVVEHGHGIGTMNAPRARSAAAGQ